MVSRRAMAKRSRRSVCLVSECGTYAVAGLKVCRKHSSPNALQQEVERLKASHPEGAWRVLRYPEMRAIVGAVAILEARAVDASSNGSLGAAMSAVKDTADKIERLVDGRPGRGRQEPVGRCGRDGCDSRDRAQPADVDYCGYCGGLMPGRESGESPEDAVRASRG